MADALITDLFKDLAAEQAQQEIQLIFSEEAILNGGRVRHKDDLPPSHNDNILSQSQQSNTISVVAENYVIKDDGRSHDKKRLFYSTLMSDNLLECIVSKVKVVQIPSNVNFKAKSILPCDFYFDMTYSMDYSTFSTIVTGNHADNSSLSSLPHPLMTSTKNEDGTCKTSTKCTTDETYSNKICKPELALLDMYSGCGGMSTGLCIGTKASGVDLVTRLAVDLDEAACQSLKLNHMETQIRNESAEDFLDLLKEWDSMCKTYGSHEEKELRSRINREADEDKQSKRDHKKSCEYEVEKLVDICYGDPTGTSKRGLKFKVTWRTTLKVVADGLPKIIDNVIH